MLRRSGGETVTIRLDIKALIEEQASRLRQLSPPIEAFGIGGSFGQRHQDQGSDADFFLLYPSELLLSSLQSFPREISHPVTALTTSELDFQMGFGFQYVFIFPNGLMIEYFLNSRETLTLNPMRRSTNVIYDSTGFFTEFTARLWGPSHPLRNQAIDQLVHEILMHILTIRKYASRGDLLPLLHRLDGLRQAVIALDRYRIRGEVMAPHDSDKKLGRSLGEAYLERISTTIPSLESRSILSAFTTLREMLRNGLDGLDAVSISQDFNDLERRLYEETRNALDPLD